MFVVIAHWCDGAELHVTFATKEEAHEQPRRDGLPDNDRDTVTKGGREAPFLFDHFDGIYPMYDYVTHIDYRTMVGRASGMADPKNISAIPLGPGGGVGWRGVVFFIFFFFLNKQTLALRPWSHSQCAFHSHS